MLFEMELEYPLTSTLKGKGFLAYGDYDELRPRPLVLIFPDWRGRSPLYCEIARKIAHLGYIGFAVDMYGNARLGATDQDKKELFEPLKFNRPELLARLLRVMDFISKEAIVNTEKMAAIGYCFGGMCALDLARFGADLKGIVSLHGLLYPPNPPIEANIKSKVLILHGYEDTFVHPDQVIEFASEMTSQKVDWQIHMYGNTHHSFTRPDANDHVKGLIYDAKANVRSWEAMKYFLSEVLI